MSGKVSQHAERGFAAELATAIDMQVPILILLLDIATAPEVLRHPSVRRRAFAPLSAEILITALRATHSATGRIDDAAVRAALPNDAALSELEPLALGLAMRAPTAKAVAERIAAFTVKAPRAKAVR